MRTLTLLGPQRLQPTLASALHRLDVASRLPPSGTLSHLPPSGTLSHLPPSGGTYQIAAVTAGWQEREAEIEEMREHLGLPVVDLRLHRRCEQAFAEDPGLFRAHRSRQNQLREMHQLYRYRLDFTLEPARTLLHREGNTELLEAERKSAIEAVCALDRQYLRRIAEIHQAFERDHPPGAHPALERQRAEVANILDDSAALAIAGGHVAVLVNRLRLFRLAELAVEKPIVAWSAGAMALAERIVLFHDSPPQGAGNAEVLDLGLGLYSGLLPLPHARRRLRLDDPFRVELFARRFAPDVCLLLDDGDAVTFDGDRWQPHLHADGTTPPRRLTTSGRVEDLAA